jgi:hypothetical protein
VNRRPLVLHATVIVLGVLATLVLAHDPRFLRAQLNADTLWPVAFVWDLLHGPAGARGFQFSTNSSLFPDLVLGAGTQAVLGSWRWALVLSTLVRFVAFGYIGGRLASAATGISLPLAALYVEGLAAALIVLNTALPATWNEGYLLYPALFPIATLYVAATHSGAFAAALVVAGIIAWSMHAPWQRARAAPVFVLTLLVLSSDRELWLEFVFPLLLVAVVAAIYGALRNDLRRYTNLIALCMVVFAAALVAQFVVQPLFNHAPDLPTPTLAQLVGNVPLFLSRGTGFGEANPNLIDGLLVLGTLFVLFPILLVWRPGEREQTERAWLVWLFSLFAICGGLAFTIALYVDFDSYRYVEPVLFLLVPIAVAVLVRARSARIALRAVAVAASLVLVVQTVHAGTLVPGTVTWQPDLAGCVGALQAQYGLEAGLADYWTARPLTLAADERLQVDQIHTDGSPQYYTNDLTWYTHSFADPGRPPRYRFIVLRDLDSTAITKRYGRPDHIAPCSETQVWIYDDPQRLRKVLTGS